MINMIQASFDDMIDDVDWMIDGTKFVAKEKVRLSKMTYDLSTFSCIEVVYNSTTSITMAKQTIKLDWRNDWANNTTGRSLFIHMTTSNSRDSISLLTREEHVTIL